MALTIKLRCPHHPRYDPSTQGQAAIRGGCVRCNGLFDLYNYFLSVKRSYFGQGEEPTEPDYNS